MEATKICTCCKTKKQLTQFYKRSDNNSYRAHCKECIKNKFILQKEEIYQKRKDIYLLKKDELNKKRRQDRINNPDKYIEVDKKRSFNADRIEYKKSYNKNYRKTLKGRLSEINKFHKRRNIIKKGNVSINELQELYSRVHNCYWCDCKLNKNNTHLDHYIPLSKGGEHTISNLVLSCSKCNLQKNAKDPYEFALTKGKLF